MGLGTTSNRLRQKTSVYADFCARHEAARLAAREEDGCADEFFRFAETGHGGVAQNGGCAGGWGAVFVEEEAAVLFGGKEAGGDGVDAHAFGRPFAREELREADDRGLRGGIGHHAR